MTMRKLSIVTLALCLASCTEQMPPVGQGVSVTVDSAYFKAKPVVFKVAPGKSGMSVLRWSVEIENIGDVQADRLVISAVDDKQAVLAEDDIRCNLMPGKTGNYSGEFDVPSSEVFKIKNVLVGLVTDSNG